MFYVWNARVLPLGRCTLMMKALLILFEALEPFTSIEKEGIRKQKQQLQNTLLSVISHLPSVAIAFSQACLCSPSLPCLRA